MNTNESITQDQTIDYLQAAQSRYQELLALYRKYHVEPSGPFIISVEDVQAAALIDIAQSLRRQNQLLTEFRGMLDWIYDPIHDTVTLPPAVGAWLERIGQSR